MPIPKTLSDYITEADRPEDLMARYSDIPGGPTWLIAARAKRLDSIVNALRRNAFLPEIRIFGSAAEDDGSLPADIDAFVDYGNIHLGGDLARAALGNLLEISRDNKLMLDPFVLVRGKLYTRNADSTGWVRARNARSIVQAGRKGLPLTLFDRSFASVAHAGLSQTTRGLREYLERAEETRKATVIFEGIEIPARMLEDHTPMEIAMILGGH